MERYSVGELFGMATATRQALGCVKVNDQSRAQLELVTDELGGKMCTKARCTTVIFPAWTRTRCSACVPKKRQPHSASCPGQQLLNDHRKFQDTLAAVNQIKRERIDDLLADGYTVLGPDGSTVHRNTWAGVAWRWYEHQLMSFGLKAEPTPIGATTSATEVPSVAPMGLDPVAAGRAPQTNRDACPTVLPTFVPIRVFQDASGYLTDVSEANAHTAVLGSTGDGKTHLAVHLIMQWAPVKGWNHGWAAAIMPKSVSLPPCPESITHACRHGWHSARTAFCGSGSDCWRGSRFTSSTTTRRRSRKQS
eukprot:m.354226 g.354226  ORF g.354226 m.354226 type:complete len:307 (-) comp16594_c0_seq11:1977-2897(-)